jgi:hypothetical protein
LARGSRLVVPPGFDWPPVVDHRFARERFLALAAQHLKRDAGLRGNPM